MNLRTTLDRQLFAHCRTMHQKMQALIKGEAQVDQASREGSGAVRVRTHFDMLRC